MSGLHRVSSPFRRSPAVVIGRALAILVVSIWYLLPSAQAIAEPSAKLTTGWNDSQLTWLDHARGLVEAKRTGKPMMVVVHTTWCPYCKQYRTLFSDPKVVKAAQGLVLVMVDRDKEKALANGLGPPGQTYVPRTLFLTPDGVLMADVANGTGDRSHLVDYYDPDELLGLMAKAAAKSPRP